MITFRLEGVDEEISRLEAALDDEMPSALTTFGNTVAEASRSNHLYQNRTGELERNTVGAQAEGRFMNGTLTGGVIADTEYAQYVNDRPEFEFLQSAFDRVESRADEPIEDALTRAAQRAGWH